MDLPAVYFCIIIIVIIIIIDLYMIFQCNDMLIIRLLVKLIDFHFMICILFKIFCMIQSIITDDKWPLILG